MLFLDQNLLRSVIWKCLLSLSASRELVQNLHRMTFPITVTKKIYLKEGKDFWCCYFFFFLKRGFMWLRLALHSLCSQFWPQTPGPSASTSQVLPLKGRKDVFWLIIPASVSPRWLEGSATGVGDRVTRPGSRTLRPAQEEDSTVKAAPATYARQVGAQNLIQFSTTSWGPSVRTQEHVGDISHSNDNIQRCVLNHLQISYYT